MDINFTINTTNGNYSFTVDNKNPSAKLHFTVSGNETNYVGLTSNIPGWSLTHSLIPYSFYFTVSCPANNTMYTVTEFPWDNVNYTATNVTHYINCYVSPYCLNIPVGNYYVEYTYKQNSIVLTLLQLLPLFIALAVLVAVIGLIGVRW